MTCAQDLPSRRHRRSEKHGCLESGNEIHRTRSQRRHTSVQKSFSRLQQGTADDHHRRCAVTGLDILRTRKIAQLVVLTAPVGVTQGCATRLCRTIFPAGWVTFIFDRIVAPSLVMMTSPDAEVIILSIPRGPKLVRTASATAFAAVRFALRMSLCYKPQRRQVSWSQVWPMRSETAAHTAQVNRRCRWQCSCKR